MSIAQRWRDAPTSIGELREATSSPGFTGGMSQILKMVGAATFAWWLAVWILNSQIPFLAPWVAMMVMMPTVAQSIKHGVQSTIASWIGVGLSYLVGTLIGVHVWSLAVALFLGLLVGKIPGLRARGVQRRHHRNFRAGRRVR